MFPNYRKLAAQYDAEDKPLDAANAYECCIETDVADFETYMNLAFLYFECRDHGYFAYHHLSNIFIHFAWKRMYEILDLAEKRYGKHSEIDFWRLYFRQISIGDPGFISECKELANPEESLVPYFYLYIEFPEHKHYKDIAKKLYATVSEGKTAKERYIKGLGTMSELA